MVQVVREVAENGGHLFEGTADLGEVPVAVETSEQGSPSHCTNIAMTDYCQSTSILQHYTLQDKTHNLKRYRRFRHKTEFVC